MRRRLFLNGIKAFEAAARGGWPRGIEFPCPLPRLDDTGRAPRSVKTMPGM